MSVGGQLSTGDLAGRGSSRVWSGDRSDRNRRGSGHSCAGGNDFVLVRSDRLSQCELDAAGVFL
jgi:hypothetical protein